MIESDTAQKEQEVLSDSTPETQIIIKAVCRKTPKPAGINGFGVYAFLRQKSYN